MSSPYPILSKTFFPLFKSRVDKIEGLENLPKSGNYIICPNHLSYLDPIFIKMILIPRVNKNIYFITKELIWRQFKKLIGQKGIEWLGMIPKIEAEPAKSLEIAKEYLKKGELIGFFPEGTRNPDKPELLKGKTGAARLALWTKLPIIPIGYFGPATYSTWQAIKKFLFSKEKIKIIIGKPIYFHEYYNKEITKELLDEVTKKIMTEISKLCGKNYPY